MITSLSNGRVKQIRRLRERKARQESGLYYLEGLRVVGEALESGAPIEMLVISRPLLVSAYGQALVSQAEEQGIEILELSDDVFRSIALKEGPQGLAAVAWQVWTRLEDLVPRANELWIALYQVADPGNLGTILRTMDAVGGCGAILLENCTDPYDPSAARASMGALFTQKLVRASLQDFIEWKKLQNIPFVGTSDAAGVDYHDFSYPARLALLMGSEREGLPPELQSQCDAVVGIPMQGVCDSLNLSVAAAVMLYEVYNQRRAREKNQEG